MKIGILIYPTFTLVTSYSFCAAHCDSQWKEYTGNCYYVSSDSATWYQADKKCKNMGAQLTSILNEDEDGFIWNIISASNSAYWIGLRRVCAKGSWLPVPFCNLEWQWSDNSSTDYIDHYTSIFGYCWVINPNYRLESLTCGTSYYGKGTSLPIYYICKKEASDIRVPQVPQLTSTGSATAVQISTATTTVIIRATTDMFINGDAKLDTSKIIPVVVAIAVVVIIIVIVVVVVCMKRRKKASQSQQQQAAEPNIYSVPPVVPSAPPLETLYDSRTESVTVQGSVLNQETTASTSESNINSADENLYTALTSRSGSAQPAGVDNPSYDTLEGTLSMPPSGSDDAVQYAVVKKVKRDPTELELVDNPNYETHSNGLTQ